MVDVTSEIGVSQFDAGAGIKAEHFNMTGLAGDIRTLFNSILNGDQGFDQVNLNSGTALEIDAGAITVTHSIHTVDTESDVASDDLDTITCAEGDWFFLVAEHTDRTVVIRNNGGGTGNIRTLDGQDHSLDSTDKAAQFIRIGDIVYLLSLIDVSGGSVDPLALNTETELTIASGAITATQTLHTVDTESDAASDDLDTITFAGGDVLYLRAAHTDRTVVIRHGQDNILTWDGLDHPLDDTNKIAHFVKFGSSWLLVGFVLDVASLATATPDGAADYGLFLDDTDGVLKRALLDDFLGGGAGGGLVPISDVNLTGGAASSMSFTTIPGTPAHLKIKFIGRSDRASNELDGLNIVINSDTGATSYSWRSFRVAQNNAIANTIDDSDDSIQIDVALPGADASAGYFAMFEIDIYNYALTNTNRHLQYTGQLPTTAANHRVIWGGGIWKDTSNAITQIDLTPLAGSNFVQYSRAILYGVED